MKRELFPHRGNQVHVVFFFDMYAGKEPLKGTSCGPLIEKFLGTWPLISE
jgi:hypothetical protein